VAAVVVIIVVLLAVNGHPDNGPTPSVVTTPRHPTATASPAVTSPPPQPPSAPVRVLNNSTRQGLAHRVAAQLRSAGWRVVRIGNLRGRLSATTLYFAPRERAAAHRLARQFPSIQRVEPDVAAGVHGRLTLVVTRYWKASRR
jgi:hypothetical protein